ncbi:FAD-dependent monooxygenase [Williamsia sp. MIQD14]|uniref:FAD-dependent monooxygenase n=1 Tax=Williamsia sp. MIQD14 TaxID=3425703 RepID=UPI003DA0584C
MTTVLISGASIAGPTAAYWLARAGFDVTMVERFDGLRPGGQSVDVRGAGRTVARRMGVEDLIRAAGTGEKGLQFVDTNGKVKAAFAASDFADGNGPTAELEILRGDLARIVFDAATAAGAQTVFGDTITDLDDDGAGVHVTFAHGAARTFDHVIIAEGMRSRTRRLIVDDADAIRPLGMYTSYFTIPRAASDTQWASWCSFPGSRSALVRPDTHGTTRAALSFITDEQGLDALDTAGQKAQLRARYGDDGWEMPRVLDGMDASTDFYFEGIGQVKLPTWGYGRVVLLGDSAYCASPVSGMGTSLSLVGAYVLAHEMIAGGDAFARYESILRPYVAQAQKLPPGTPRVANPKSRLGVRLLNAAACVAASRPVQSIAARFSSPPADAIDLPDYPSPVRPG